MSSLSFQTMAEPHVALRAPLSHFFNFPPSSEPRTLPTAQGDPSLAHPFSIDPQTYNGLLNVRVPLTVAAVYATTVFYLNRVNKKRGNKAWGFSKTRSFFSLVILHNIFLALYSGWTFVGMINAVRNTWPGWEDMNSLVEVVDAFCKVNGPRGLGDAPWYNVANSTWTMRNPAIKLLNGQPDASDIGRLWNEGLAFYGWLFYLSKFYEVVDTLIILAKGKRSSFLQTYHHAGAMICMWAGIRYMSPPIWMFVCINSAIHALMYTYYTLSALNVKVPVVFKQLLTTMQITQFVVGFTYAVLHLFVVYRVPVHTPYVFFHNLSTALPSATSAVASAASTGNVGSWVKKAVLRAAGDEGLSENVRNNNGKLFGYDGAKAAQVEAESLAEAHKEIRYRLEYTEANCIDTSGQAFAILLNALYLLPLTMLFLRFFVKSYLKRSSGKTSHPTQAKKVSKSSYDAVRGVEREVLKAMSRDRGSRFNSTSNSDTEITSPATPTFPEENEVDSSPSKGNETTKNLAAKAKDATTKVVQDVKATTQYLVSKTEETVESVEEKVRRATGETIARVKEETYQTREESNYTADQESKESDPQIKQEIHRSYADAARTSDGDAENDKADVIGNTSATAEGNSASGSSRDGQLNSESREEISKDDRGENTVGESEHTQEAMARSYETSFDEVTTAEQKEAEAKMQPEVVNESVAS